ncbi:hypothetical protein LX36DRAFT_709569 [Colletotrichum falcatum]|nr:hypothetical protein LX36DRAFT_709569 [Colletotrichum falcatum]
MFNITLATLFPLPDEVDDRNEPPLLAMLWTICLEFIIAFLSIWILSERFLRIKTQQDMAEREGKLAEHKGKLAELISEFKQVSIYSHGLITDADDFVIPFHETMIGFFEIKDLIAGALWDDTKDGVNPAAAAGGVEISSSALFPHNIFMRKAEECLILIASARKSLRDLATLATTTPWPGPAPSTPDDSLFCDENGVVIPETRDKEDGELFV